MAMILHYLHLANRDGYKKNRLEGCALKNSRNCEVEEYTEAASPEVG